MAYTKTKWEDGMIIEANALNNIEDKIEEMDMELGDFTSGITINDNEIISPNKDLYVGNTKSEDSKCLGINRLGNDGLNYSATMSLNTEGTGSIQLEMKSYNPNTNETKSSTQINISKEAITPNNSEMSLGSDTKKFNNGYFAGKVYVENGLDVFNGLDLYEDSKGSSIFNFKSPDGTITYGSIEKHLDKTSNDIYFKSTDGIIYFQPIKEDGYSKVNFGTYDGGFEAYLGTSTWRFAPYGGITTHLGHNSSAGRWSACYLKVSPNVSSDRNLKENIVYLDDKEATTRQSVLTTDEMYNFVKNELKLTKYNYINKDSKSQDDHKDIIGFIAQDIATNEKVGSILLTQDEEGIYGYDTGTYTNILAGALQKALNKIDDLEARIVELENK